MVPLYDLFFIPEEYILYAGVDIPMQYLPKLTIGGG